MVIGSPIGQFVNNWAVSDQFSLVHLGHSVRIWWHQAFRFFLSNAEIAEKREGAYGIKCRSQTPLSLPNTLSQALFLLLLW